MLKVVRGVLRGALCLGALFVCFGFVFGDGPAFAADFAEVNTSVNIKPSVTVTVPDVVSLYLDPSSADFDSELFNVKVGTNNPTGYQLVMTAPTTELVSAESGKSLPTLPTLAGGYTEETFVTNKWGYKKGNTNYLPFETNIPLLSNNQATTSDNIDLTFGAKIDYLQPAGLYELTLNFNAVANYLPEIVYMQDMDSTLCATEPLTVVDYRDGKEYTVQRLADGECWMTSNLNLAGGTKLYSETSNVPAGYPRSGGTPYYTLPTSSTSGFNDDTQAYVYNSGNETTSQSGCTSSQPCNSYYSWLAATAGGKDASGNAVTDNGYNAAYSICPKGWRLPTATTSNASAQSSNNWKTGDFYKLATAYGADLESSYYQSSATFYNNAGPGTIPNFLLAGSYYSSSFVSGGSGGSYWSSSSGSSTSAYNLTFYSASVNSAGNRSRSSGLSVRCILDPDPIVENNITTMQDFGSLTAEKRAEVVSQMKEEKVYTLKDSRDYKKYTIAKLKDGQIWMTSDLNLAGGTVLNASDSDVPTDNYFTLPASSTTGFDDNTTAYVYNSGNETTDQADCNDGHPCNSYYSWLAATAGGKDASGNAVANYHNAAYSICPKGWRLPTATTSNASPTSNNNWKTGDFYKLGTAYGANLESNYYQNSDTFYNNAGPGTLPNFLLAGRYLSSSFNPGGTYGRYWSSSSDSSTYAYYLSFSSSYVDSASSAYRRFGLSVRCILERDPIEENNITTMQDFSSLTAEKKTEVVDQMNTEKVYALKDSRDNKTYKIAKLRDGQVWMTSNLNLAGGTTLNASDSDVPTDNYFTLPASSASGFSSDTTAYVYNSGNETTNQADCTYSQPCNSYYSWLAATAGGKDASGNAVTDNGYNAAYSICPKGWRLPTATTSNASAQSSNNWKTGDFYKLATAYGANLESNYYQDSATFYNNAGPGTLPNFLLAGDYFSSSFYDGDTNGRYWSSSSYSSTNAYYSYFNSSAVSSADNYSRRRGFSVRCVFAGS